MKRTQHSISSRRFGFTLLEVMIAVVVLATGLLAIAALQGSLTRASAEAKVRGRVAAMLTARMDELRRLGYDNAALATGTTTTTSTTDPCDGDATDWIDCPRVQAALGSLSVKQETHVWSSAKGASSFTKDRAPTAGAGEPEFKRVELSASWKDATGADHSLAMTTQFSSLTLQDSLLPDPPGASTATSGPIVREDNPEGAGVIPIALGNGESSAASNPTPELEGKNQNQTIVGTRFNVLTYTPEGTAAVIQRRFETDVIKCTCQYGAGGTNLGEIYQTAQWPAIWTGERYDVYKPDSPTDAPGQQYSSGPTDATQSPYCTECCRDHHDGSATDVARFDPEATGAYQKYNRSGSNLVATLNTTDATYVDSCRMIRVDGLWRTAADMYSRQFGLLETEHNSTGVKAKTGVPTTNSTTAYTTGATENYTQFVKDYLQQYDGSTGAAPTNAQTMYDDTTRGLNNPPSISIATPSTSDFRYLHARGLYVDYLEKPARDYIAKLLASRRAQSPPQCQVGGSDLADCVLPFLPFTTVNLTEIAGWAVTNDKYLSVNESGSLFNGDASEPQGGATRGIAEGSADVTSTMRKSNSGVAVSSVVPGAVDLLGDDDTVDDNQNFTVGTGGNTNTGDDFYVSKSGGGFSFAVDYAIGGDTGPCTGTVTQKRCVTNSTLPAAGSVTLSQYNGEESISTPITNIPGFSCTYKGNVVTVQDTNVNVPSYHNYAVTSVTDGGVASASTNNGKTTEATVVTFTPVPKNTATTPIIVTLADETGSPIAATFGSCEASQVNNKGTKTYWVQTVTWSKPWETP